MALYEDDFLSLTTDTSSSWSNGDIRLVTGEEESAEVAPTSGRLEVYMNTLLAGGLGEETLGTWGTVCGLGFTLREANVACRQLGYASASKWELSSKTE